MGANEGVCEYLRSCFKDSFLENSNILFTSLKRFSSLSQCVLVYNTLSPLYRCLHLGLGFRCHRFISVKSVIEVCNGSPIFSLGFTKSPTRLVPSLKRRRVVLIASLLQSTPIH